MPRRNFEASLAIGDIGERIVEGLLKGAGCGIIPSSAYTDENEHAPRLSYSDKSYALPDFDVVFDDVRFWVEVKLKQTSPWNRTHNQNVHGINIELWDGYLKVEEATGCSVWIFVVEHEKCNKDGTVTATEMVLGAPLSSIAPFDCQCVGCETGGKCRTGVRYFSREQLVELFEIPA